MTVIIEEVKRRLHTQGSYEINVWVDNFVFATNCESDMELVKATFREVAEEVNLTFRWENVKDDYSVAEFLGMTITHKSIKHTTSFLASVKKALEKVSTTSTPREIAAALGKITWAAWVRSFPLSRLPSCLLLARELGKTEKWDNTISPQLAPLILDALPEMEEFATCITSGLRLPFLHTATHVYSDASDFAGAFTSASHSEQFAFLYGSFDQRIYIKELVSACIAILAASIDGRQKVHLFCDNAAVVWTLRSGHSGTSDANRILYTFFGLLPEHTSFSVSWVPTTANLADPYTRGIPATAGDWALRRKVVPWSDDYSRQF